MAFPGSVHRYSDTIPEEINREITNAANELLWSKEIPTRTAWHIHAIVLAMLPDGSERAIYERTLFAFRADGAASEGVPQVAPATPYYESAGAGAYDVTLDVSSPYARLRVTATGTVLWRASIEVNRV